MSAADLLAPDSPGTWPAGILAAADRRTEMATQLTAYEEWQSTKAWHLAGAKHWRGVVERHAGHKRQADCDYCGEGWPCPDLTETADEVRAYLGGAT